MKRIKKILAVFLALLTIASIFSIDASAVFVGVPGSIAAATAGSQSYNIYSGGLGENYYVI